MIHKLRLIPVFLSLPILLVTTNAFFIINSDFLYEYGFNKDFDSAKIHLKKANLFAVRSKKKELIAYVNIYKSRLLYWEAKTEEAKSELENLIANKINDTLMVKLK